MANGFMVFSILFEDEVHAVIEKGPWLFGGKAILLQQWHHLFAFDKNKISKLPVWVRLHGLPFPLWNKEGLSQAASMIGRPLSCDSQTHNCERLEYARLCVEIDASLSKISCFDIINPLSSDPITVEVEYEWMPPHCTSYKIYGHSCKKSKQSLASEDTGAAGTKAVTASQLLLPTTTKDSNPNQDGFITIQAKEKAKLTNHNPSSRSIPQTNLIPTSNHNQSSKGQSQCLLPNNLDPTLSQNTHKINNLTNITPTPSKEVPQDKEQNKHSQDSNEEHPFLVSVGHMDETCPLSKMDSLGSQSFTKPRLVEYLGPQQLRRSSSRVKSWINKFHPNIVGLLETKVAAHNLPRVTLQIECGPLWDYLTNNCQSFSSDHGSFLGTSTLLCILIGDREGDTQWHKHHIDFHNVCRDARLIDLPYKGMNFTRHNGQQGDSVFKRSWTGSLRV
ncbi:ZINC KNUCKLE CX2CX4HX4C-RELATED [Salix viminalis]|uniref:ZINC KNUCKLE CX2CX4HX4C-RELATED n=1 Tax=Salix viminalis TaxID=40686 RepID=A0A9Q0SGJ6_SALVM|nr:ZINC KNUCKLE CX2CX4HX4C-RELATED [Salix viminalis]